MMRFPAAGLLLSLVAMSTACNGPRLRVTDVEVHSLTPTFSYSVTVTNLRERNIFERLFCWPGTADGGTTAWQCSMRQTPETPIGPNNRECGGIVIVDPDPTPPQVAELRPGESHTYRRDGGDDSGISKLSLETRPYLFVTVGSRKNLVMRENSRCSTWNTEKIIDLRERTP